ncbi:hypothetical protein BOBR111200_20660 [Bordetella bronchialis]
MVVFVSPAARLWKSSPGLKVYEPSARMMNVPPAEPATSTPCAVTSLLPACTTVSVSPSGSMSRPTPCALPVRTLPDTPLSSVVEAASFTASGPGLVTFQLKVSVTVAPLVSVAVTVTW